MRVLYCSIDRDGERWVPPLQQALPQALVAEWTPGAAPADYAVVWKPPQQFLDEQPGLKALFNTGAGVDALLQRRLPPGVPVIRLEDAGMGVQMAEYVCHAVIRHFRELADYEHDTRQGVWRQRPPPVRSDFGIGVLGLGVLGQRVARALRHFEFPVRGWSLSPKEVEGVVCHHGDAGLAPFLQSCRVLVCLLPLTPDTDNLLDRARLSQLPQGAYLINVARGAHVVDADLLALLDEGYLAGATLDVFRTEPLPPEHPFWRHPRITLTPHTSARTLRADSVAQIAAKIVAFERGEPVSGRVDLARGY